MDVPFHVINEYEILKKVLFNLNGQELVVASEVNQYWKSVAYKVLEKKAEVTCVVNSGKKWSFENCNILPKLVIYSRDAKLPHCPRTKNRKQDFLSHIKELIEEIFPTGHQYSLLCIISWKSINSIKVDNKVVIRHSHSAFEKKSDNFQESLLMLPQKKNLQINVDFMDSSTSKEDYKHIGEKVLNAKCCIILSADNGFKSLKSVGFLCGKIEMSKEKIPMAGGIAKFIGEKQGKLADAAVIMFSGENLSAQSFLLPETSDIQYSLSEMSKKLGPVKPGYERISFVFACVDRYAPYKESETKEFAKHFPDVPLNGFWSQGEFCLGFTPLDDYEIPVKRCKLEDTYHRTTAKGTQYMFQQSSIYLFITYKKE